MHAGRAPINEDHASSRRAPEAPAPGPSISILDKSGPLRESCGIARPSAIVAARPFARALEHWFRAEGRDYPWRRTTDPYPILVSEIMLQQTQIATVLDRDYYDRWMRRFPDFATLARAGEPEVLKAWEGLGYYRRARFLHRLAQTIMSDHQGAFPRNIAAIRRLPGIGDYTAGAIASFAFDDRHPIVDGNVARVLSRVFDDATPVDSTEGKKRLWERAATLVEAAVSPRIHNSALMELGQTLCRPAQPTCLLCPVRDFCRAEDPASLPVKSKRPAITAVTERVYFLRNRRGAVLLEQETGNRRTGLWKLPALPELEALPEVRHSLAYTITRYRVTLHVHGAPDPAPDPAANHAFIPASQLAALPMPSPYRRALDAMLRMQG